ncbi:MAG: two-CW domain-containing protein [Desulfobaccales bacterium]
MDCWEFKKCGQEPGCPAYPDCGTQCAQVAGTLCGGKVQGLFALKLLNCRECDFYRSPFYDRQN